MPDISEWIASRGVEQVEVLVADFNGILRGKTAPAASFVETTTDGSLRLASSVFSVMVNGAYAGWEGSDSPIVDPDTVLVPDPASLRVVPGVEPPTAWVFADSRRTDGTPWPTAPRQVLARALAPFAARGWAPVIAPELEFYLIAGNADAPADPRRPLAAASDSPAAPYGLEALARHGDLIATIRARCLTANVGVETAIHESGPGQLEINLRHGEPVARADEALLFKRIVRQAARERGLVAAFMAFPLEGEAPNAMHLHLSLVEAASGANLFADADGQDSERLLHFIGGLQRYLPEVAPLYAPNPNSFRRMRPRYSAPVSVEWGHDNRSCGLRVPLSSPAARRVEIRQPGADANPYLAMAAALASGWLGLEEKIAPAPEAEGNAYRHGRGLPRTLEAALERLAACAPVREILGEDFISAFLAVKEAELSAFAGLVTPWEREHLLGRI